MKKGKLKKLPVKPVISGILLVTAVFLTLRLAVSGLCGLDYFRIKDVSVNKPMGKTDFSHLLGRSIFHVDLKKESRYISDQYPVYKNIRIFRIFPDRIYIVFADRQALAAVKSYRAFHVDSDGVFFEADNGEAEGLPLITGLERKIPAPKSGRRYNIGELTAALNIIEEIGREGLPERYRLERISVSDPESLSCFMRAGDSSHLEVKIGRNGLSGKISVLSRLLNQLKDDTAKIKYVDLRFKEPVIKFSEDKTQGKK